MTSEKRNWFEAWFNSPYYHLLYDHRDEREARRFISKLITHLNPPPGSRMLDLACGKGRHAAQLAEYGYEVTGLDIAEDSILAAREQYASPHLQFAVHDMRQPLPFPQEHFDYVFNLSTSFGYFETEAEHLQTLQHIARSLKRGGTFVMDFMNAE
ncbi:MAG TPA: class I SAM-dependent methyltransferase, partial [Bacteroidetes bacterium]|nr:class I SAM-dependent methyltransferase [Bacteroidota bacterium]